MTEEHLWADNAPEWLSFVVETALPNAGMTTWVPGGSLAASGMVRVPRFPTKIPDTSGSSLKLDVVPGGVRSAQLAAVSTESLSNLRADISDFKNSDGATIDAKTVETRVVGYVPVERAAAVFEGPWINENSYAGIDEIAADRYLSGDRNPDLVADPLLERDEITVPAYRAQPLWISFRPPIETPPGEYNGTIALEADNHDPTTFAVTLDVRNVPPPDLKDGRFHLDVWFQPDAVAAEHDIERWSGEHWQLLQAYFDDLASAGQRVILTPIVDRPWAVPWLDNEWHSQTAAGYESLVKWYYDGEWTFNFERFDRFIETALTCGIGPTIGAYSMLTFRAPQRLSYYNEDNEFIVEETEAGSERWKEAWTAFLRAFVAHLKEHGWLEQTYLSFDERPPEQMEDALSLVTEVAPEFEDRIQIAGSDEVEPLADDLSVLYQYLPLDDELIQDRRCDGRLTTFYVCVTPSHPNTFAFSPAVESRMLPWIVAHNDLDGFLRWAYNSWPSDPFKNPVYRGTQGGEYLVYPGDEGPISSIRWELLREGIEEYELVAMLRANNKVDILDRALTLATREPDARTKDVDDLVKARRIVFDALERHHIG